MAGTFDFCPNTRVVEEMAPSDTSLTDMNGWTFAPKSKLPYRAQFRVMLYGLRWRLNAAGNGLNTTTQPTTNAGRLREFYVSNRLSGTFTFQHEFLGSLICRFAKPLSIPAAVGNSGGLLAPLEVMLEHHNPSWTI